MHFRYIDSKKLRELALNEKKSNMRLAARLKRKKPDKLDRMVHKLHEEAFEVIDCLACANCCKTLGPRLTKGDIDRMAKGMKMKPSDFKDHYTKVDEDGDYIFNSLPCPFLKEDNHCRVYNYRPKACREYPHTDRKNFVRIIHLTIKNAGTCPVVFQLLEEVKKRERELIRKKRLTF